MDLTWYFLSLSTGRMQTGWLTSGGHTYFLNPRSGAGRNPNRPEGAMLSDWVEIGQFWYYFNPGAGTNHQRDLPYGAMFVNRTNLINGVMRQFDRQGRWLIWHSDSDFVSFWPGNVSVHTQVVGSVSQGFQFALRVTESRLDWGAH